MGRPEGVVMSSDPGEMEDLRPAEGAGTVSGPDEVVETDPARLLQRQKQIDMGKATPGYRAYLEQTPK